jgi:hypothetical protein
MRGLYSLHLILYTREAAHSSELKLFLWAISLWEGSRSPHTGYHACAGQVLHRKLSGPGTLTASIVTTTTRKQRAGMPICPPVRSCRYRGLHRCHLYIDTFSSMTFVQVKSSTVPQQLADLEFYQRMCRKQSSYILLGIEFVITFINLYQP